MKTASATTLILGLSAAFLQAQAVPALISYQGKVVDSSGVGLGTGTPVNRKILFRLFDAGTGGNRLWSEEQTVTLSNGDFSVILGQGIAASYSGSPENPKPSLLNVFGGTDRYLEIVVDNGDGTLNAADTPISPRQRLIATAFAIRAATADSVATGTDLGLRDANNGLGWYGTGRLFNGVSLDGPVLYGTSGGGLGSVSGSTQALALRWNNSGNVGIGGIAASSTHKLDVNGSIRSSSDLMIDGKIGVATTTPLAKIDIRSVGVPAMAFQFGNGGYRHFLQTRHNSSATALGNAFDFYLNTSTTDAGSTAPGTGNIAALTIDAQGVGVGTTSPTAKLDVIGNLKVSTDAAVSASLTAGSITTAGSLSAGSFAGIRLPGAPAIGNAEPGISNAGGYISFNHTNTSEDYIGYASNTFFLRDTVGGGDTSQPNLDVGGRGTFGGNNGAAAAPTVDSGGAGMRLTLFPGTPTATPFGFGIDTSTLYSVVPASAVHAWYRGTDKIMELNGSNNLTVNNKPVPVAEEALRIIRGNVAANGAITAGSGFTVVGSNGDYTINFTTPFSGIPSVTATTFANTFQDFTVVRAISTGSALVSVRFAGDGGVRGFPISFIAIGPR